MELISQIRLSEARSIKLNVQEAFSSFYSLLCNTREPVILNYPATIVWGWGVEAPSLLYTNGEGYLSVIENINSEHLQNFLLHCSRHQHKLNFHTPLCVARTREGTSLVYDSKSAMCLWHRNQVEGKPILLQRFIMGASKYSKVMRVHWTHLKTQKTLMESRLAFNEEPERPKTNLKQPRRSFIMRPHLRSNSLQVLETDDLRYLVKFSTAKKTYDESKIPELDLQLNALFQLLKQSEKKLEASLLELAANFIKGRDENWYLINVENLMFSKHSQMQPTAKETRSKTPSRYKLSLLKKKTLVGKFSRSNSHKSISQGQTPDSRKAKSTSHDSSPFSRSEFHCNRTKLNEMPPLFSFPTPEMRPATSDTFLTVPTNFSDCSATSNLPIMAYGYKDRLQKIKDYIDKQNNSLYARIHYCEELPTTKLQREAIDGSLSRVAKICDQVRARAKLLSKSYC